MGKARKYIDFKLYLTQVMGTQDSYQVSLLPTPEVGESISPVQFSISASAKENLLAVKQRRISNLNLLALGKELADWLLPAGTIRELFSHALKLAKNRGGVRLR
ncbi:MAG: hypothetical protein AAGD96_22890, partial [Chloroflexota bacterium]